MVENIVRTGEKENTGQVCSNKATQFLDFQNTHSLTFCYLELNLS